MAVPKVSAIIRGESEQYMILLAERPGVFSARGQDSQEVFTSATFSRAAITDTPGITYLAL